MCYFIVIKEIGFFLKEKIDKMKEGRKFEIFFICYKNIWKLKVKIK